MARRPRPDPRPPPPPEAPLAAELLTAPGSFFTRLRSAEPKAWRYLAPVLLAAVLAGVVYALLVRPTVGLGAGGGASTLTAHATNVFGNVFLTVLGFGLMAGLGYLGAGREGRAAEVYGATFVLLPPVYLLLIVLLLVLPGPGLPPAVPGADALALQRAILRAVAEAPLARLTIGVTLLGTLAQFALAYRGLLTLTGSRLRALLGTLSPLVPVLLLVLVGFGPLVVGLFW